MCLGSEGDLPRPTPVGAQLLSVDFRSTAGGALSLQRDAEGTSAWLGKALDLAELAPANLRELEGWTIPAAMR